MGKAKVMFVSAVADFKGGAETCLKQFMSNPDVSPMLIVPSEGELARYARERSIPVDVVDFGLVNDIRRPFKLCSIFLACIDVYKANRKINKLAKDSGADCIHSNGLKTHGILAFPVRFNRVPVICHIHDIPYTAKEKLFWRFLAFFCHRLVLVSRHCWGAVQIPKNASIVPNGIKPSTQDLTNRQLKDELSIGFVGRIHPHKGLALAIEWLSLARSHGFRFQFYIRGEAAVSDREYEQHVRKLIEDNGLADVCHFEGRIEDYSKVYSELDITLMPSVVAEPFGLVAIESFDQGAVCFAYPSGALPSIIEDSISGYLCETADEFVIALKDLTSDPEKYNQLRNDAFNRLQSNYSISTVYNALNDIYRSVVSR